MSSGTPYGEQLLWDIRRLRRHFPAVPVKVILIDVEPRPVHVVEAEEGLTESLEEQKDEVTAIRPIKPRKSKRKG